MTLDIGTQHRDASVSGPSSDLSPSPPSSPGLVSTHAAAVSPAPARKPTTASNAASTSAILSWSDEKVKSCSSLRARKDLRRNLEVDVLQNIQKALRTSPNPFFNDPGAAAQEALRQAQIYKAWIQDQEGSSLEVAIVNDHPQGPADGCPPYDFVWVNGYVHDDTIPPSDPSELQGCDCEDDACNPATCKCFQKAVRFDTLNIYKESKQFAYNADGTLQDMMVPTYPIFECNSKCGCSSACTNRVVQKGRRVEIEFFKHQHYGWGVRARHRIKRHTFIGIYSGELVSDAEADRRAIVYEDVGSTYHFTIDPHPIKLETMRKRLASSPEGRTMTEEQLMQRVNDWTRLMDLYQAHREHKVTAKQLKEFNDRQIVEAKRKGEWSRRWQAELEAELAEWEARYREEPDNYLSLEPEDQARAEDLSLFYEDQQEANELTVDGALHGNFTRFFNHSCDPNLATWPVWIEEGSIWRPFFCFFALRNIEAGDELNFSYTSAEEVDDMVKRLNQIQVEQGTKPGTKRMKCLCGASNCRGFVFG
ncbi:uncharacterized protein PFL1_05326 [Pseudozyma flocculosa PF-1]|uniref:SET domain-containing protein n=2 Tax=Pseudozyma flocculosa TaxID=84751 RepID=A0A5C3FFJ4_9BASI|nr:uncharacterized protein PFL1_05326 [Pseudozyma flocculosa PF-1]EPQ27042.1 hypothetical protein PFL1_05326 [Pseudozyma flocculosa PF-1]SPO42119.1 uncharacterized protein PSFLO_07602 [Pseudozyma flocculosa]